MPGEFAAERSGAITWKGSPVTLQGRAVAAGDKAPDFRLSGGDLIETAKFSKRIDALPADRFKAYAVSMDLPFAQKRWCVAETVQNIGMLSDFRDHSFGYAYGVRAKEKGLLARAIFIIGRDGIVLYVQVVPDAMSEPDYEAAMAAATSAAGA